MTQSNYWADKAEQDHRKGTTAKLHQLLKDYRCTQSLDEEGFGLPLTDVLTPLIDADVSSGELEMLSLAEYLEDQGVEI